MPDSPSERAALMVALLAIGYLAHVFLQNTPWLPRALKLKPGAPRTLTVQMLVARVAGGLLLGGLPLLAEMLSEKAAARLGWAAPSPLETWGWAAAFSVLALGGGYLASRNPEHRERYPQIREVIQSPSLEVTNALSWVIYLWGYELAFRGSVLFSMVDAWGPISGVVVAVTLYSFAHLNKGIGETVGCIPVGVLFSLLALYSNSFIQPWVIHVFIALSSDTFSTRRLRALVQPVHSQSKEEGP